MVINLDAPEARYNYLLDNSDYSLLVTDSGVIERGGKDYPNERVFWYTSGTTGDSKFYSFTNEQVDRMAQTICKAYDINSNDRYFGVMPLWHAHGNGFYWATRLAGCEARFGSIQDQSEIETFQPTFMTSIPDMMSALIRMDLQNLRFVRTASSAMPIRIYQELRQRFNIPVIEAFGMTEALSHCFTNPLYGEQRIGTVGLPDNIQIRIDDQHLWIQGPCTAAQNWIDTGDLAEHDDNGYVRILGRHVDRINVRGYKIDPLSVERQIYDRFEEITECAVFGQYRLKCVYVGQTDPVEIADFLTSLGSACRPRLLHKLEEIPKNTNGKISRSILDQLFS